MITKGNAPGPANAAVPPARRVLPGWGREAALMVLAYAGYDAVRGLRHRDVAGADRNGRMLLHLDTASHLSPEHGLNQLLRHLPPLAVGASYFYATLHFIVTPAVLAWTYRRRPQHYRVARTTLIVATLIALVGFWIFPATPPRLLPGSGVHDTLADVHRWGWWSGPSSAPRGVGGLSNDYAAMPSLHVIWASWVGLLLWRESRRPLARAVGVLYPTTTALVVMATGNHYLVDVLAGVLVLCAASLVARYAPTLIRSTLGTLRRTVRRRWVLHALVAAASTIAVTMIADPLRSYLPDAGRHLRHPGLGWLTVATACELVSIAAFSQLQRTMLRAGGTTVGVRRMLGLTFEANAVSGTMPAGSALAAGYNFRRLRSWDTPAPVAGYALVVSGLLSTVAFGVLAAVAAALAGGRSVGPIPAVLAGGLLVAVVLGLRWVNRHPAATTRRLELGVALADRLRRRPATKRGSAVLDLVNATSGIRPTAGTWSIALAWAALNWTADLACLLAAGHAAGAGAVTLAAGTVAYSAGMSVSGISLVPGGLGVVEAAMILTLGNDGIPHSLAIAAVVLYRGISYLLMVAIGWSLWLIRRRSGTRARSRSGVRATAASSELSAAGR